MSAPMRELLDWLSTQPRSYAETIDAWRSSCPRLTIWEDALHDGLVQVVRDARGRTASVGLTPHGKAALGDG